MFVGSFSDDFDRFQADVNSSVTLLQAAGATHLIIDLHNNGGQTCMFCLYQSKRKTSPPSGGFVCLGHFLHQFIAGTDLSVPYVTINNT